MNAIFQRLADIALDALFAVNGFRRDGTRWRT